MQGGEQAFARALVKLEKITIFCLLENNSFFYETNNIFQSSTSHIPFQFEVPVMRPRRHNGYLSVHYLFQVCCSATDESTPDQPKGLPLKLRSPLIFVITGN